MSEGRELEIPEHIQRLWDECDARNEIWKEANKHLPCEDCGTKEGVAFHPTGSAARLTPLCAPCLTILTRVTEAYWDGFDDANRRQRDKGWWARLTGK